MDPALWELFERSTAEEVEAVIRLEGLPPPIVRLVSRFGEVATCRLRRQDIVATRRYSTVRSLKASRRLAGENGPGPAVLADGPRPRRRGPDGRGVVVGVVDWGCDFAHPAFRDQAGRTRLLCLWDQRGATDDASPAPYGYGRAFSRQQIDAALDTSAPYAELGYHPGESDSAGTGTHGTHVLDIAAGTQRGVAPGADLVFVHLGERGETEDGIASSVTLLEALDFIDSAAADRPCVVNLSLGRHGGPHDGSTLVELAVEHFINRRGGRLVVHSAGNYFTARTHARGSFLAAPAGFDFEVPAGDPSPNELDLWYRPQDAIRFRLWCPSGEMVADLAPGQQVRITLAGEELGRGYHRVTDPNNGEHNVHLFLDVHPLCEGRWRAELIPLQAIRGDFDAYLERDKAPPGQARFVEGQASPACTTGTICHAPSALAVGAYDSHLAGRPPSAFTSSGPTRQGRLKPDLCAPGVRVTGARSTPLSELEPLDELTEKSGSSMAAPQVAGTVALLFELRPDLTAAQVRDAILGSADPLTDLAFEPRLGAGYLNTTAAVAAVGPQPAAPEEELSMTEEPTDAWQPLAEDTAESMPFLDEFQAPRQPALAAMPTPPLPAPTRLFAGALRAVAPPGMLLLGAPGQRLQGAARPGDLVVVGARGEGNLARSFEVRQLLDSGQAVVAPSNGGAPAVRPLLDGSRLPLDTALFRSEASDWSEVFPVFPVGHVLRPRRFERLPITFENLEPGATGEVIRRLRCDTLAEVTASDELLPLSEDTAPIVRFIRVDDLIRSFTAANALWREDATGHLEAALDLCVYYPARAVGSADLAAGGPFPLVVICMGNHQAFETSSWTAAAETLRGHTADGREIRQVDRVTFGPEVLSHLGYSAVSRTRPPDTPGAGSIDYLQEELARQGMISVSVSTNPANVLDLWVETRADLVLAAASELRRLHLDAASPFHRQVAFERMAYVGHSRGGDAVLRALHKRRSTHVKALVHLGSTDITGLANGTPPTAAPPGAPLARTSFVTSATRLGADLDVMYLSIYGSRDGDVSGRRDQRSSAFGNPFRHYDRASAQRVFQFWHGGTHNRFNRFWEDAQEEPLLNRAAGGLLSRRDQEARTSEAVSGWLRFVLSRETAEAHRFDGRTPTAIAAALPVISMWKFGPRLKTIDRFDDDTRADRNTLGGRNVAPISGLVDEVRMANDNPPGAGESNFQFMHIDPTLRASLPPPLRGGATSSAGSWRAEIPTTDQDFGRFSLLTLRVTRHFDEGDVTGATTGPARAALLPTVTVTLRDRAGGNASAPAASPRAAPSLPEVRHVPVGASTVDLTKYHFETWQVPLSAFAGVDPHRVAAVEVELSGQSGHSIYIDTLSLVEPVP